MAGGAFSPYTRAMEFIDFSKDYQRLFRFDHFTHLFLDNWMRAYTKRDAMTLTLGENTTYYLPKSRIDGFLHEGTEFFADDERFQAFRRDYEAFMPLFPAFATEHVIGKESLDLPTVDRFLELGSLVWDYFYRTEFFYLDEAFKLRESNETLKTNMDTLYRLKEQARIEHLNGGFFGSTSYIYVFAGILARQFDLPQETVMAYGESELRALFNGQRVSDEEIATRGIARIIKTQDGERKYLFGESAKKEIEEFREKTGDVIPYGATTLKGIAANKGVVRGKVKIITSNPESFDRIQDEFAKMQKGDILVAETTSPEYMPALAKAGGVVADQGGLLSHAAVVSREFGVPCIVAAKYATKIFKDGDMVEVDADAGVVRKLS